MVEQWREKNNSKNELKAKTKVNQTKTTTTKNRENHK